MSVFYENIKLHYELKKGKPLFNINLTLYTKIIQKICCFYLLKTTQRLRKNVSLQNIVKFT